jgi:neutral ceramidase
MATVQAGVSRVVITPPVGMYLPGMERFANSHGLRDDIFATALALSDGVNEVIVINLDVLLVHQDFVERIRQQANQETGVPVDGIMICATHCHSGPVTLAGEASPPMYQAYAENLFFTLVGLIRLAHDRLQPAKFGFGTGSSNICMNRRLTRSDGVTVIAANPDGPVDPQVGVFRVDSESGEPLAVVVNYACHPVVLGNGSNVISADWPGAMRRTIEQISGAKVLFIQGAAADINPWPGEPTDDIDILERLGTSIGGEVLSVWARIQAMPEKCVSMARQKIWIPLLPISEYTGRIPELVELNASVGDMSFEQLTQWLEETMPWSVELQGEHDDQRAGMELQVISVGDTALISAAGEIFVKTGLGVKTRSPFANTMFAGYTNGSVGYIPLPEDFPRGGYEVQEAYLGYRLPAPVAPEAAGIVENEAVNLLLKVKSAI